MYRSKIFSVPLYSFHFHSFQFLPFLRSKQALGVIGTGEWKISDTSILKNLQLDRCVIWSECFDYVLIYLLKPNNCFFLTQQLYPP